MTNAQSKHLPENPPHPRRTQEIATILSDLLNGDTDIPRKIVSILKEVETDWGREWYIHRYRDFIHSPIPKWRNDFSNDDIIEQPIKIARELQYLPTHVMNDRALGLYDPDYPVFVEEVKGNMDHYVHNICIQTLREGFIRHNEQCFMCCVKDKVDAINSVISQIKKRGWYNWSREGNPLPDNNYSIYDFLESDISKECWPVGYYEAEINFLKESINILQPYWTMDLRAPEAGIMYGIRCRGRRDAPERSYLGFKARPLLLGLD